jgi:hypothetical protein
MTITQCSKNKPNKSRPGMNITRNPMATYFKGHPWRHLRGRNSIAVGGTIVMALIALAFGVNQWLTWWQ